MNVRGPAGEKFECTMEVPDFPHWLIKDDVEGTVRATAVVLNGRVTDVDIVSGPEALHPYVRDAMRTIRCGKGHPERFIASQEFVYVIKD